MLTVPGATLLNMLSPHLRKVPVSISLTAAMVAALDEQAIREDCTRSEVNAKAIRDYLERAGTKTEETLAK
jgi:metal-responsive CopG/Arc/MetJ family transcriptional regulator